MYFQVVKEGMFGIGSTYETRDLLVQLAFYEFPYPFSCQTTSLTSGEV